MKRRITVSIQRLVDEPLDPLLMRLFTDESPTTAIIVSLKLGHSLQKGFITFKIAKISWLKEFQKPSKGLAPDVG